MSRRSILVVAALLLSAGGGGYLAYQRAGPMPKPPADIETLDPLLRRRIEQELVRVGNRRRSTPAWRRLGMVYEANALYGDAARCYEHILSERPNDGESLHRLARVQERMGDLSRARSTMERSALAEPGYAASWCRLALWSLDLGEHEAGAAALEKARALTPDDPTIHFIDVRLALARRSPDTAISLLERGGLLEGAQAPYGFHLLSNARRQAGDIEGAAAAHAKGDGSRLRFSDPWTQEMQRWQTGYAAMRRSAGRHVLAGRFAVAQQLLEQVLAEDPLDVRSLNMLAVCRIEQGDPGAAMEILTRLLAIDPVHHDGALNFVRALLRHGSADGEVSRAAFERLQRALELRPSESMGWRLMASLEEALGRPDESLEAMERAMALEPAATDIRLKAGYTELKKGAFDDALERFRGLKETHPELTEAWFGEVATLVYAGRASAARTALEELSQRSDADPERLAQLASAVAGLR
ncbi:MAG: hypothetical protein CMJ89_14030 [Planctomycetes bacterium]|nr:hypothetical protein [Planctomycetota bacterium]